MKKRKLFIVVIALVVCLISFQKISERLGLKISFSMPMWGDYDSSAPLSPSSNGSAYKAYYENLSNRQKYAYNAILNKIYTLPDEIEIPEISSDDLSKVFHALLLDNPDLFFVGRKCETVKKQFRTYFSVKYNCTKRVYDDMLSQTTAVIDSFTSTLTSGDDEWETERKIHDFLLKICDYSTTEGSFEYSTVFGCLVNNKASCEGYAKAFKMIADNVGLESLMISGLVRTDSTDTAHMWNLVKIGGNFYHIDCTWDDPVSEKNNNYTHYTYFNVNDSMIGTTHKNFSIDIPCTQIAENYHVKNGLYFEYYTQDAVNTIKKAFSDNIKAGVNSISLRFGNSMAYSAAISDLVQYKNIRSVFRDTKYEYSNYVYYKSNDTLTLDFVLE